MEWSFGLGGSIAPYLGPGWGPPGRNFTFSLGAGSEIALPPLPAQPLAAHPPAHGPAGDPPSAAWCLELHLSPFVQTPKHPQQRLTLRGNGLFLLAATLTERTHLGCLIPAGFARHGLRLTLETPDAIRHCDLLGGGNTHPLTVAAHTLRLQPLPADRRPPARPRANRFALAVRDHERHAIAELEQRLGLSVAALLGHFESAGDNCEFGLFQRKCGYEPLGMLRFSAAPLEAMVNGLNSDFADLAAPPALDAHVNPGGEWMITESRYRLKYHSFVKEHDAGKDAMLAREVRKLGFLRRKFVEDMHEGFKFFVIRRRAALRLEEILPAYMALHRRGGARLLYVVPAPPGMPPGTVEEVLPGLFCGYIDRLQPADALGELSLAGWLEVCAAAWQLVHGERTADCLTAAAA